MTDPITINGARGEVELTVDGRKLRLCLTLGALAEIESVLGCITLEDLEGKLQSVSAGQMMRIAEALLRGGQNSSGVSEVALKALDAATTARSVLKTFKAVLD